MHTVNEQVQAPRLHSGVVPRVCHAVLAGMARRRQSGVCAQSELFVSYVQVGPSHPAATSWLNLHLPSWGWHISNSLGIDPKEVISFFWSTL